MGMARIPDHRLTDVHPAGAEANIDVKNKQAAGGPDRITPDLARLINDFGRWENLSGKGRVDSALPPPEVSEGPEDVIASARTAFEAVDHDQATADLFAILTLLLRVTQARRKDEHEMRFAGYQKQERLQYDAANRAREAASARMWASIVGAGVQIAGSAVTATTALASAGSVWKEGVPGLEQWTVSAENWHAVGQVASSLGTSLGNVADAGIRSYADEHDAQKMELDAAGRKQEQATQVVNEQMQLSLDAIRNLFENLRSIEQLRQEINRGFAQRL